MRNEQLLALASVYGLRLDERDLAWLREDLPPVLAALAELGRRDLDGHEPATVLRVP